MMRIKKIYYLLLALSALLLVRCVGFEPVTVQQGTPSKYSTEAAIEDGAKVTIIDNPKLKDGIFEDFSKDVVGWWSGANSIKFVREQDYLKVDVAKTTAGYPQFGVTFEPKDFTNTPVVRIRMRAEGDGVPRVRL